MKNNTADFIRAPFTCAKGRTFHVTYARIQGGMPGPTLALVAGQHGMEHIGPVLLKETIRDLSDREFRGTVLICPCANPLALELDFEFYPENEDLSVLDGYFYSRFRHDYCPYGMERKNGANYYNMNRLWNRDTEHGIAGRIAKWLWEEMVMPADMIIDFHCLQAEKPLIFADSESVLPWAACFGIEAIYPKPEPPDEFLQGTLARQSCKAGKIGFCVEFSAQHGYKDEYDIGRRGIRNSMAALGMTVEPIVLERPVHVVRERISVPAEAAGHIHFTKEEYDIIRKGDPLFEITGLETPEVLQVGRSPIDGIYGRRRPWPIATPGEPVLQVCKADTLVRAGETPDLPDGRA